MIYILLIFYTIHGQDYREMIEQPSYHECVRAKQMWLREAREAGIEGAEAFCVGRREAQR